MAVCTGDESRSGICACEVITRLYERGIQARAVWGLINEQMPYRREVTYKLEKALYYAAGVLNIPSGTQLTETDIQYVAESVKNVLEELA